MRERERTRLINGKMQRMGFTLLGLLLNQSVLRNSGRRSTLRKDCTSVGGLTQPQVPNLAFSRYLTGTTRKVFSRENILGKMIAGLDGPGPLEITRLVLYGIEWLMATIIWGATTDQLRSFGEQKSCYFGRGSNCGAVIFFGVVAWLVLSAVIVKHLLMYFSENGLERRIEAFIFAGLAVVWALVGLISATGSPGAGRSTTGNAVVVFSWFSIAGAVASGAIAFYEHTQGEDELNAELKV